MQTLQVTDPVDARRLPERSTLLALFALTLALLWGGAAWVIARDQAQAISLAEARLLGFAQAFAEHARSTLQRADSLLLNLRQRWIEDPRSFAAEVQRQSAGLNDFAVLTGVVDAKGWVVFNSAGAAPVWSGDRHHYLAHRGSEEDRLLISPPVFGRITKKWFVQLSRKLGAEGAFEGVVYVSMDLGYYVRFYESLGLGPSNNVAMFRDSGELLLRNPFDEKIMGTKITGTPFLAKEPTPMGNYRRISQTDGVERMVGYVRLPEFGVTITVSEVSEAVLAPLKGRAAATLTVAAVLSILFGVLFYLTFRSITARNKAERATRALNDALEQRVLERTSQLTSANRELEAFAYSVSHDLKAPLRGIDGYSSLLLDEFGGKLGENGDKYIGNVRRATKQMENLISDMLEYAHLERSVLVPEGIALQPLVQEILDERTADIAVAGVRVENLVPILNVAVNRNGLGLALRNLIDNALKFSRTVPAPSIEVGARDAGASIEVWVKDNGPGFDMVYHDQIFQMFQRLNRAEEYPGTGIGLALVRKAMERIGGRTWARSAPGEGATFYLDIPK